MPDKNEMIKQVGLETVVEDTEKFSWGKFWRGFTDDLNPVKLAKSIRTVVNLPVIILVVLLVGGIYLYGYWKGHGHTPISVNVSYEKPFTAIIPIDAIKIDNPANSSSLYWIFKNNTKREMEVKDIMGLNDALKPWAFCLKPIAVVGVGEKGLEGGVGLTVFRFYQWRLHLPMVTNGGYSLGIGYNLSNFKMPNTTIGLSYGKSWKAPKSGKTNIPIGLKVTVEF